MDNTAAIQLVQPSADLLAHSADALRLRSQAAKSASGAGGRAELKRVSQEFESLFVAYLLKVMRETIEESGLTEGSFGKSIYTDLFDQEFARGIAQHGALGISELLMKRLSIEEQGAPPENDWQKPAGAPGGQPSEPPVTGLSGGISELERGSDVPDFRMPVQAPISSRFGMRKDPFTSQLRFHKGLDLAAPEGTEVRAALGGEVIYAGYQPGYGNTVILRHPDGLLTRYAHLASTGVTKGQSVKAEDVLGSVGNSGRSTGPHLHFEVLRWGEQVNPMMAFTESRGYGL